MNDDDSRHHVFIRQRVNGLFICTTPNKLTTVIPFRNALPHVVLYIVDVNHTHSALRRQWAQESASGDSTSENANCPRNLDNEYKHV